MPLLIGIIDLLYRHHAQDGNRQGAEENGSAGNAQKRSAQSEAIEHAKHTKSLFRRNCDAFHTVFVFFNVHVSS